MTYYHLALRLWGTKRLGLRAFTALDKQLEFLCEACDCGCLPGHQTPCEIQDAVWKKPSSAMKSLREIYPADYPNRNGDFSPTNCALYALCQEVSLEGLQHRPAHPAEETEDEEAEPIFHQVMLGWLEKAPGWTQHEKLMEQIKIILEETK